MPVESGNPAHASNDFYESPMPDRFTEVMLGGKPIGLFTDFNWPFERR